MRSGDQIEPPNCEDIQEIDGDQFANGTGNKRGVSQRGKAFLPPEDRVIVSGWLNISTDAATGIIWNTLLLTSSLWFDNYLIVAFSLQVHLRRAMPSMQGCIVISFKIVRWVAVEPNCLFSTDGQLYERKSANSKLSTRLLLEGMKVARTTMIRYVPITICCMFLNSIYLFMNNLFLFWVQIKDAIKFYEQKKPWHFAHCWEILRDEPKWNDYMLQCSKSNQTEKDNQATQPLDTPPAPIPTAGAPIERPEGRDSVKKHRTSVEESSSSVAVEMLEKIHVRGQQMDELEAKQKEELIDIERAKFDLQQKIGKIIKNRGAVQNIEIVARPRHSEKCMPNSQVLGCNSLKNNSRSALPSNVLAMPAYRTRSPLPMHAIDTSNHPGKTSSFIFFKNPLQLSLFRWS